MNLFPFDLHITYSAGIKIGDWLFLSCNVFNGLFKYNLRTEETVYLGMFDGERVLANNLHQRAFRWRNKIIFVPSAAKCLCLYDISLNTIEYIKLHEWDRAQGMDCFLGGDNLWIFYADKKHFGLKINLDTRIVQKLNTPDEGIYLETSKSRNTAIWSNVSYCEGKVYIPLWMDKTIVCFDLNSDEYSTISIEHKNLQLASIAVCDGRIFFTSYKDWNIYCYDIHSKRVITYAGKPLGDTDKGLLYPQMIIIAGRLYIFPEVGNDVLTLNDSGLTTLCCIADGFDRPDYYIYKKRKRFYGIMRCGESLIVPPYSTNMRLVINMNTGELKTFEIMFDTDYIANLFQMVYKPAYVKEQCKINLVNEGRLFTLSDYIDKV